MTTLSLLKDIKELDTVKVRQLPIPHNKQLHKDFDWIKNEYNKWSKQFPDSNPKFDYLALFYGCLICNDCESKERLLDTVKVLQFTVYIELYFLPAREERSAQKVIDLVNKLLVVLKTWKCEDGFVEGKRMIECLTPFRNGLSNKQWLIVEYEIGMALKDHLKFHCDYWLKHRFLCLKDYFILSERDSLFILTNIFAEYLVGLEIPAYIRYNHDVYTFTEKCNELAQAVDDYYTAMTKIKTNYISSRIISILNEEKCTLQEAFDSQFEHTINLYEECLQLRDKVLANPYFGYDIGPKLSAWLNTILDYSLSLFEAIAVYEEIQVNADQTLTSAKPTPMGAVH